MTSHVVFQPSADFVDADIIATEINRLLSANPKRDVVVTIELRGPK